MGKPGSRTRKPSNSRPKPTASAAAAAAPGKRPRSSARVRARSSGSPAAAVTAAVVAPVRTASAAAGVRDQFVANGYMHFKKLLPPAEVEAVRAALTALIEEGLPAGRVPETQVYYDVKGDPASLKQIQFLHHHDPFFAAVASAAGFEQIAAALMGEPACLMNVQYFNKPPKTNLATPAHQDGFYFHIKPNRAVTMWLALDDADLKNGCLVYVRGSSAKGLRPHQASGVLGFSQKCTDYGTKADLKAELAMVASPGDLVAHDSMMLHRAGPNTTKGKSRRAVGFIYYAASAVPDAAKAAAYQQMINRQLRAAGMI